MRKTLKIILGPNESRHIRENSSLPSYIDVTPSVVTYNNTNNAEVVVNVNLITNSAVIFPKEILCEIQSVVVNKMVFNNIENETKENVLEEVHMDTELSKDQNKKLEDLLLKIYSRKTNQKLDNVTG